MEKIIRSRFRILLGGVLLGLLACGCVMWRPSSVKVQSNIEFARVNGRSLKLDIYSPKQPKGKLPVVVWLYPGGWETGSKNFCPISFMATQNLAVVSMDYRLSREAPFPAQIYDCKGAIRWLRANADRYNLDADHIGILGASAGGHLALLLATTPDNPKMEGDVGGNLDQSSRVQCVCALYPPTDLDRLAVGKERTDPDTQVAKLIGGTVAANVDKAAAASPMTYLNKDCAPVFLMHGGADTLVPPDQSRRFYDAARQLGVEVQLEIVPGKGHGIVPPPKVAHEIDQFYDKYLR